MKRFMISAAAAALLVGCVGDVGEGKVQAEVQDVAAADAAKGAAAEATKLTVDMAKSKVEALGAKITAKHPIAFHQWTGTVALEGDALQAVEFEVDVASLKSDDERLDAHLKNEDFFDVAKFPKATFKSASVEEGSTVEGMTHTVAGDLTIRGQTKRVTFPAKVTVGAGEVQATTEFTVNRQDFGIAYPGKPDDLIQDNVVLTISLVAPRA